MGNIPQLCFKKTRGYPIHKLFQIPIHLSRIYPKETNVHDVPLNPTKTFTKMSGLDIKQKISQRLGWKAIISVQKNIPGKISKQKNIREKYPNFQSMILSSAKTFTIV